jgi:hypothetical protein
MLTALQAQLELGDCGDVLENYRPIASHCLPPRFVPNIPHEGIALHHQSLRGMTSAEAKKAFLNLIQSWPLHRATIYDVMVRQLLFMSLSYSRKFTFSLNFIVPFCTVTCFCNSIRLYGNKSGNLNSIFFAILCNSLALMFIYWLCRSYSRTIKLHIFILITM